MRTLLQPSRRLFAQKFAMTRDDLFKGLCLFSFHDTIFPRCARPLIRGHLHDPRENTEPTRDDVDREALRPRRIIAIDLADSRLEGARRFGADVTINNGRDDAVAQIMELTDGPGADCAFEAVGVPGTFELAAELIRPGGRLADIGVRGSPVALAPVRYGPSFDSTVVRSCCAGLAPFASQVRG